MAGITGDAAGDTNLTQMQSELTAAQQKLAAAQAVKDQQAAQAKADLDAALGKFQDQVAAAGQLSRDNPELTDYVAAAQKLQETTHKLVDDLISRQQQNYTRLTDLQARLGEKMQARRQEMWQSDEKLKNLNDQLEYAKLQYNTALGTGDQKAAGELKAQIDLLESTIKARQDLLPDDPFLQRCGGCAAEDRGSDQAADERGSREFRCDARCVAEEFREQSAGRRQTAGSTEIARDRSGETSRRCQRGPARSSTMLPPMPVPMMRPKKLQDQASQLRCINRCPQEAVG